MRDDLRAGIAIYNEGRFHAAHDAWEDHWLGLESGTDEELLFHGLIQFTAAIYHATERNWEGAVGLAGSAGSYLSTLPPRYRDVNVQDLRSYLSRLEADPELIDRRPPVPLLHGDERVDYDVLEEAALHIAAHVLAEVDGHDEELIDRATSYTRENDRIRALLRDFVREPAERALVVRRLSAHVDRHESRRADVEGLFD
jgi:predicted metal-dependent hydrolase